LKSEIEMNLEQWRSDSEPMSQMDDEERENPHPRGRENPTGGRKQRLISYQKSMILINQFPVARKSELVSDFARLPKDLLVSSSRSLEFPMGDLCSQISELLSSQFPQVNCA
jgi:hypothetical protein